MPNSLTLFLVVEVTLILTPLIGVSLSSVLATRNQKQLSAQGEIEAIQNRMQKVFRKEINTLAKDAAEHPAGKFCLLQFCSEAEVDAEPGKTFLQKQVVEFARIIDVDDLGDIYYYFGDAKSKFIEKK